MSEYDFPQTKSVSEAAGKASSVVVGEVVSWSDGRSTVEADGAGYESFRYTAVLAVKVGTSKSTQRTGDVIYVEVPRGGEVKVNGEHPEGTEPVITTIEQLATAVPAGIRVIILATRAPSSAQLMADTPGILVQGERTGLPSGTVLLRPNVQGLLFRDETGAFAGGLADGEAEWGWIPSSTPASKGFAYLVTGSQTTGSRHVRTSLSAAKEDVK